MSAGRGSQSIEDGCDLFLISVYRRKFPNLSITTQYINDKLPIDSDLDENILNEARNTKTPILIQENALGTCGFFVYGDIGGGNWTYTKIKDCDELKLNSLPFEKTGEISIIQRGDPQFTPFLSDALEKIHVHHLNSQEVIPYESLEMPADIAELIVSYAVDAPWVFSKSILFFSNVDCTPQQILFLMKCAGPLRQFQFFVEKLIQKEKMTNPKICSLTNRKFTLNNWQGTLIQLLVTGLDQSMAKCFIEIIKKKLPDKLSDVLKQARQARTLPPEKYLVTLKKIVLEQQNQQALKVEEIKAETERKSQNSKALEVLFDAFLEGNEEQNKQAIETFRTFINDQQNMLTNDLGLYYANLIHLIDDISKLIKKRDEELPQWSCFCFEIINVLRESMNAAVIAKLFDAFQSSEENIEHAIEIFKQFDEKTQAFATNEQGYLINNLLYLDRIHRIYKAFDELYRRGGELPGNWSGQRANSFCVRAIGWLQSKLPPHICHALCVKGGGLDSVIGGSKIVPRPYHTLDKDYFGVDNSNWVLGVNYFFDIFGTTNNAWQLGKMGRRSDRADRFQTLLRSINFSQILADSPLSKPAEPIVNRP